MLVSHTFTLAHLFQILLLYPCSLFTQIFGDQPPMTTTDLHEDEIAEILKANSSKKLAALPALLLLKLFLFS